MKSRRPSVDGHDHEVRGEDGGGHHGPRGHAPERAASAPRERPARAPVRAASPRKSGHAGAAARGRGGGRRALAPPPPRSRSDRCGAERRAWPARRGGARSTPPPAAVRRAATKDRRACPAASADRRQPSCEQVLATPRRPRSRPSGGARRRPWGSRSGSRSGWRGGVSACARASSAARAWPIANTRSSGRRDVKLRVARRR